MSAPRAAAISCEASEESSSHAKERDAVVVGERCARGLFRRLERAVLYFAVGALEDLLQLFVGGVCAACAGAAAGSGCTFFLARFLAEAEAAVAVDVLRDLVPRNGDAAAVVAEDGGGGIVRVALGVVADRGGDGVLLRADFVVVDSAGKLPAPARVGRDALKVVAHPAHRREAGEDGVFPFALRRVDRAAHVLKVGHRAADALGGNVEAEVIVGLKEDAFRLHEALPHGAVCRLTEIAALGVLQMRAACDERKLYVRQRRAGQHARVLAF